MREKHMFAGSSCAGVVSASVACFFNGLVLLIWCIWEGFTAVEVPTFTDAANISVISSLIIWFWGWYFLDSVWQSGFVRRVAAYRVSSLLFFAGIAITFLSMIRLTI
ncbi:MAG TPA: hypothetical protein VFZ42_07815 [Chitinophagaceae bacterium]